MEPRPTIGRIVLVTVPRPWAAAAAVGHGSQPPAPSGPFPAIVTAASPSGAIECHAFMDREGWREHGTSVLRLWDVLPESAGPGGPRWSWPPRLDGPVELLTSDRPTAADPEPAADEPAPESSPEPAPSGTRQRGPGGRFLPRS